ncbi:Peptidase S41 OS=Streptomyces antimycoticus OX=68175 GN=SSPO_060590 PE=3 SV=1 [Streptomyces antimycoticus]
MPARAYAGAVESDQVKAAAAAAQEDGKSGSKAAREVVSRSGDRWGAVYSAREYEGFRQKLDGAYVGVGISAHRDAQGRIAVERVEPGSPAQKAGIRAGDRLRTVDGKNVTGRPVTEVVALLRGPADGSPGTRVELGLRRGGQKWTQELRRARLTTDPVTVDRLSGYNAHRPGAVRIKVDSFTKGTGERIRRAVRSTPGATASCSTCGATPAGWSPRPSPPPPRCSTAAWSPPMTSVVTSELLDARPGGDTDSPLVVLVDGGTMSAAELLTGALQDRGRAVVVGSRTFGKGSVQMPSELPDGSVAELTVGHYRTPAGRNVDGEGIDPDLRVKGDDGPSAEARARTVLSGLGGGS